MYFQLPWEQPGWLEQATTWIHAQVAAHGLRISGPVEVLHQRPWSTFARVATDHGAAYFKAPAPAFTYEAALTQALAYWLKLDEDGPQVRQLRDAYLEPWTTFTTRAELSAALALAYRLAMANRALSWQHVTGAPKDTRNRMLTAFSAGCKIF